MLSWLARKLGWVSKEERSGISLEPGPAWEVTAPRDHDAFVRSLPRLLPSGSSLYFEGVAIADDVRAFMESQAAPERVKIEMGTIWPHPAIFHVPLTNETVERIAALFARHAAPEICDHFHAYCGQTVLLWWHDAFFDDPLFLSAELSEDVVREFCSLLGCEYESGSG